MIEEPATALGTPEQRGRPFGGTMNSRDDQGPTTAAGLSSRLKVALRWQASVFATAALVGISSIVAYSSTTPPELRLRVLGMLFLFGAAAVVLGGLPGFLFGVPRTTTAVYDAGRDVASGDPVPSVTPGKTLPNTNLEQISDWLTKVLVGVTLGQVSNIGPAARRLFNGMTEELGVDDPSSAFVGALAIYGAALGFMYGWLAARVWIAWTIAALDGGESHGTQ
ncbi:hypothetical protein [Geodermatophilus maliterrae]|uniref:Uncharacterized protein n=1 Tax=Geodermatophilus maliterrae TaxID=3162531 RepID=A0ABV3XKZ9_9ACTN